MVGTFRWLVSFVLALVTRPERVHLSVTSRFGGMVRIGVPFVVLRLWMKLGPFVGSGRVFSRLSGRRFGSRRLLSKLLEKYKDFCFA